MIRSARVLFLSCLLPFAAIAADTKIGDVSLHLPPPPGYCEMDPVLASDAPLIGSIHAAIAKSGNRLLGMSADCAELRDWRKGNRQDLDHFVDLQTAIGMESAPLVDTPEKMIKNYCLNMNTLGDQAMPGTPRNVQDRAERVSKATGLGGVKFLGVVAEDPLVCYVVTLQKFKIETREETMQVAIIATTIIKEKVLAYYLFAPYVGRETVSQLLAIHRRNMSLLQRANRK
jgi:hypothetical protein